MLVGRYTYGQEYIEVINWSTKFDVIIGSFCSIAKGVKIILDMNHRTDWVTTFPFGHLHKDKFQSWDGEGHPYGKGNVIVGNDVWIATNVSILSGVSIGDGAVLAANSVVVKDVPPYAIVAGNPAKIVKYRFSNEQIENLLKICWWNWEESKINDQLPLLCSGKIDEIISNNL